jgi:hypothetical protein
MFIFHSDIYQALVVFWYAGFQGRKITQREQRIDRAEAGCESALESAKRYSPVFGGKNHKMESKGPLQQLWKRYSPWGGREIRSPCQGYQVALLVAGFFSLG